VSPSPGTVLLAALRREPPRWAIDGLTQPRVIELADAHGILPVVAEIASRFGVIPDLDAATPLGFSQDGLSPAGVLLAARRQSRDRHADLDAIRDVAGRELRKRGVLFRHLKGGALRSTGVWADFSARPTRDVDILLGDRTRIDSIESALIALGFERSDEVATSRAWEDDHHDLPLIFEGRAGSLELHAAALAQRHRSRIELDIPGFDDEPDLATTLRHVIIHAQLQDDALLQWRLPIVALLDVAFALESELVTGEQLIAGFTDRVARRAGRIHLGLASRLRGSRFPGSAPSAIRWWIDARLFERPRLAYLVREAVFVPRALSRSVMQARFGHELGVAALARARFDFLRERIPRGARGVPRSGPSGRADHAGQTERSWMGAKRVNQETWQESSTPTRVDGFEAAWSASGLVLIDLSTDVLHHLNGPAAVVYDLVGDRTAGQICDAYATLAEVPREEAWELVGTALNELTQIKAVAWPVS